MDDFSVYEHWRPDTDACFYVGKGRGYRAFNRSARNERYRRIAKKLARLGMCVEVRMVASGLAEDVAFRIEQARIAFWKEARIDLANMTNGGEGTAGRLHSEQTKAKIGRANANVSSQERARRSAMMTGRRLSDETKAKIKAARARQVTTAETKAKIGLAQKGRRHSIETRKKMAEGVRRRSLEYLEKLRALLIERNKARIGHRHSEETKRKMSESHRRKRELERAHD